MNRISIGGAVVAALVVAAPAVASHNFDDVPSSHPHHAGVDWVADAGITAGCDTDSYCPSQAVSRGQMATFLHRYDQQHDHSGQSSTPSVQVVRSESQYATCPAGTTLIGGGFIGDRQGPPYASFPNGNRWEVWGDLGATVYAICMG